MVNKEKYNQLLLSMSTFYAFNGKVETSDPLQEILDKYIKINSAKKQEDFMEVMWEYTYSDMNQEDEKITGLSQLEVIPKKLMLDLYKVGEQLDEIIIICTEKTEKNISVTPKDNGKIENNGARTTNDNYNSEQIITLNISSTKFFEERIKDWCQSKNFNIPKFNSVIIDEKSIVPGDKLLEIVTKIRDKKRILRTIVYG